MKTFLHVGCGHKRQDLTPFVGKNWKELRLDIDADVQPDLIGTMTDMASVDDDSVDAIFSSHNIEHLYPHEVPLALAEFKRVLRPNGFLLLTCPDMLSVCKLVAEDKLTEPAYQSGMGPIAPLDIIYGHRASLQQGNFYMAHRCGFTTKVLSGTLQAAGFSSAIKSRPNHFDLWAVASIGKPDNRLIELAHEFFPS